MFLSYITTLGHIPGLRPSHEGFDKHAFGLGTTPTYLDDGLPRHDATTILLHELIPARSKPGATAEWDANGEDLTAQVPDGLAVLYVSVLRWSCS